MIKLLCEPWRPYRPSSTAQLITSTGVDAPLKIMASSLINPGVSIKASVINNHFGMCFLNSGLLCACPSCRRWWPPAASRLVPPLAVRPRRCQGCAQLRPRSPGSRGGLSAPHPKHMGTVLLRAVVGQSGSAQRGGLGEPEQLQGVAA